MRPAGAAQEEVVSGKVIRIGDGGGGWTGGGGGGWTGGGGSGGGAGGVCTESYS